jgi:hypothetical protein
MFERSISSATQNTHNIQHLTTFSLLGIIVLVPLTECSFKVAPAVANALVEHRRLGDDEGDSNASSKPINIVE